MVAYVNTSILLWSIEQDVKAKVCVCVCVQAKVFWITKTKEDTAEERTEQTSVCEQESRENKIEAKCEKEILASYMEALWRTTQESSLQMTLWYVALCLLNVKEFILLLIQ